jgi:hypothetical protein
MDQGRAGNMGRIMTNDLQRAQAQLEQARAELEAALRQERERDPTGGGDAVAADRQKDKKNKKDPGTARGIETLFRSAYRVQMDLTGLADNKANMMISINSIIISIILAAVAPKLDANPWLLLPTLVLLAGNLVSIIYAIQAARPRIFRQEVNLEDLHHSAGNILFFGNFASLGQEDFVLGMNRLMAEKSLVYDTMIRNIYGLGTVLNRKFALLQAAYTSFMIALVLGVCSFMLVFVWLSQQTS